jgi:Winged helix-turn helix
MDVDCGGRPLGIGRTLGAEQAREVQQLIRDRTPNQLEMVYALWTRLAVAELIHGRYGIKLATRTMGLCLARWGFTPQIPMKKNCEQSPAAVKRWIDEEYPVIAACAKVKFVEIRWSDETGLRIDDLRGRSYAPQGPTPLRRTELLHCALSRCRTLSILPLTGCHPATRAGRLSRQGTKRPFPVPGGARPCFLHAARERGPLGELTGLQVAALGAAPARSPPRSPAKPGAGPPEVWVARARDAE